MTTKEFKNYLQSIIDSLDDYEEYQQIKVQPNTYGMHSFIATGNGFIDLDDMVENYDEEELREDYGDMIEKLRGCISEPERDEDGTARINLYVPALDEMNETLDYFKDMGFEFVGEEPEEINGMLYDWLGMTSDEEEFIEVFERF